MEPMPIVNRLAETAGEIAEWRRHLHAHPELLYDVHETAAFVADKLRTFGCDEVVEGIGRTGVVGVLRGKNGGQGKVILLRADMDGLPITEAGTAPYKSRNPGLMHACGHDGHTAMLLGAARQLADSRNFAGTVVVAFQPAEEGGAGGKAMVDDGLMERVAVEEVYGMHNMPGMPVGSFALRPGPLMASADRWEIDIEGRGGHAAAPHLTVDPVLAGSHVVTALHSIVSRNVDPLKAAVVSVTVFQAGTTDNVIPQTAHLAGTARSLDPAVRDLLQERITSVAETVAAGFGAKATVRYKRDYPVTVNDPACAALATRIATEVAGEGAVNPATPPVMGAEDFSFMLEARPGAFIFVGNGDSPGLHHPAYDFADAAIPYGASYWVRLAETALAG
jgi:hippurate hydrolase